MYYIFFYIKLILTIIVDTISESDKPLHSEDFKKTSLKQKITNKCAIENKYNSDKERVKKKRFSKYLNIATIINKIIKILFKHQKLFIELVN